MYRAALVCSLTLAVTSTSCGDSTGPAASLCHREPSETLAALGDTVRLTAVVRDASGHTARESVEWSSRAPSVVTVDAGGLVTAVGPGTAQVGAAAGNQASTTSFTVSQRPAHLAISAARDTLTAIGDSVAFVVSVRDSRDHEISGLPLTWDSSAPDVAGVTDSGIVIAVGSGQATIRATSESATGVSIITVRQTALRVEIQPADTTTTALGDSVAYRLLATDARGHVIAQPTVTWNSDSQAVALVTSAGTAVTVANGETRIAAAVNGVTAAGRLRVSQTATELAFQREPRRSMLVDERFNTTVQARDRRGHAVALPTTISLRLIAVPGDSGALVGPATAGSTLGSAQFSGLAIDRPGRDYRLTAGTVTGLAVSSAPIDVAIRFVSLFGDASFCGADTRGVAWCWGVNSAGQLGTGDTITALFPRRVPIAQPYLASLVPGPINSCGRTGAGAAFCWGYAYQTGGRAIAAPLPLVSLSIGNSANMCGLSSTGQAFCVGPGNFGQLGNGTNSGSFSWTVPTAVLGGLVFRQVAPGSDHMCGITVSGPTYCWGRGAEGQIGNAAFGDRTLAAPIAFDPGLVYLATGLEFTCGLTVSGAAYCWGRNDGGNIGLDPRLGNSAVPGAVPGGHQFTKVSVGSQTVCGLTTSADAFCWGFNFNGELGAGDFLPVESHVPLKVLLPDPVADVTVGTLSACALLRTGRVYCWGYYFNSDGTFSGDGTGLAIPAPLAAFGR